MGHGKPPALLAGGGEPSLPAAGKEQPAGLADGASQAAFTALYRRQVVPVYQYFYHQIANHHEAEDLTAATFAKVLAHAERYAEQGRFAAWLFTIARNTLRDYLRCRKEYVDLDRVAFALPDRAPEPESEALRSEGTRTLRRLIGRLPGDQREAIELRFFADLSVAETAQIMGRSEAAVKMLVHRAFVTMRDLYAREVQP